jgi:hypothetical protein
MTTWRRIMSWLRKNIGVQGGNVQTVLGQG